MRALRFNRSHKTECFLAGATLALATFAAPGFAQNGAEPAPAPLKPAVEISTSAALRIGELAPSLLLRDGNGQLWNSRAQYGKNAQFWFLEGDSPVLDGSPEVAASAQKVAAKNITCALITSKPAAVPIPAWPAPFVTLRDEENALATKFPNPSFIVVDRAGWLREVEVLPEAQGDPENLELRWRIEKTGDPTPPIEVGKPAPDFAFQDSNGLWRRVSDLRGKRNLILTFFPKCFTGKCKNHLTSLRDQYPAFRALDTDVWAVSVDAADGPDGQKAFARELNAPFPFLPDVGRNICLLYDAAKTTEDRALRQSVIIDKNGIVRWIDQQVNPETHGVDLLARLGALGMIPAP